MDTVPKFSLLNSEVRPGEKLWEVALNILCFLDFSTHFYSSFPLSVPHELDHDSASVHGLNVVNPWKYWRRIFWITSKPLVVATCPETLRMINFLIGSSMLWFVGMFRIMLFFVQRSASTTSSCQFCQFTESTPSQQKLMPRREWFDRLLSVGPIRLYNACSMWARSCCGKYSDPKCRVIRCNCWNFVLGNEIIGERNFWVF